MTDDSPHPGAPGDEKTPEPVAIAGAVQVLIGALIGFLVAFGVWHPTNEQIGAMVSLNGALAGLLAVLVRQRVTPWRLPKTPKGMTFEEHLDQLALAAYLGRPGIEPAGPDEKDLHALGVLHGVNEPGEQGGGE